MYDSQFADAVVTRPVACPSCKGRIIETLAKVITAATAWRCRECERVWTIAGTRASAPRMMGPLPWHTERERLR